MKLIVCFLVTVIITTTQISESFFVFIWAGKIINHDRCSKGHEMKKTFKSGEICKKCEKMVENESESYHCEIDKEIYHHKCISPDDDD